MAAKVENAIRSYLSAGKGILKIAALVGVGSGTVQQVRARNLATSPRYPIAKLPLDA